MASVLFRRGSRMGTQIHSIKHVEDTEGELTGGNSVVIPLTVVAPARDDPFVPGQIVVGETVNAFYITLFVIGATGAPLNGAIDWYIGKLRSGQNNVTDFPTPNAVGPSSVRNQIFHQEKGLAGSGDGTAMAFKGVIVLPRGMRRQRSGDEIFIKLRSGDIVNNATFCLQAIFKSFS